MSKWYTTPENTPQQQYPSEIFVGFVATNYYAAPDHKALEFLELGSGSGADVKFLEEQGFNIDAVDSAPQAYANFHETIEEFFVKHAEDLIEAYDCIYSLNVLCHINYPPYREIARALKPHGKFFAIVPAMETQADLQGRGFTRLSSPSSIRDALEPFFSRIDIAPSCYPRRQRNHQNWVIEADK